MVVVLEQPAQSLAPLDARPCRSSAFFLNAIRLTDSIDRTQDDAQSFKPTLRRSQSNEGLLLFVRDTVRPVACRSLAHARSDFITARLLFLGHDDGAGQYEARVSSWDRSGKNVDFRSIKPGGTLELAKLDGAGCIRHIYFTIVASGHYLRDLVIRMYWDGEKQPSVEVPFGDFFGLGFERPRFIQTLMVTINPGYGGYHGTIGFNTYFPMPYSDGALLTLTNEGTDPVPAVWYHVEYEKLDSLPPEAGSVPCAVEQGEHDLGPCC